MDEDIFLQKYLFAKLPVGSEKTKGKHTSQSTAETKVYIYIYICRKPP